MQLLLKNKTIIKKVRLWNLKTQQSSVILLLCLKKTRIGKSNDDSDYTVFRISFVQMNTESLRFQILPVGRADWYGLFELFRLFISYSTK